MEISEISKEDLIKQIMGQREKLSLLGVKNIGLFGSFARGEQTNASDIDILVEFVYGLRILYPR